MLLEVITQLSGDTEPYLFNAEHFCSYPMNLKNILVLEGNWTFIDSGSAQRMFDKFSNDPDIKIDEKHNLIINIQRLFTSNVSECKYCGTVVEDENSLCYNCKNNNDKMYMLVREGLAYYKYDKDDKEIKEIVTMRESKLDSMLTLQEKTEIRSLLTRCDCNRGVLVKPNLPRSLQRLPLKDDLVDYLKDLPDIPDYLVEPFEDHCREECDIGRNDGCDLLSCFVAWAEYNPQEFREQLVVAHNDGDLNNGKLNNHESESN